MADVPEGTRLLGDAGYPTLVAANVVMLPGVPQFFRFQFERIAHLLEAPPFRLACVFVIRWGRATSRPTLDRLALAHPGVGDRQLPPVRRRRPPGEGDDRGEGRRAGGGRARGAPRGAAAGRGGPHRGALKEHAAQAIATRSRCRSAKWTSDAANERSARSSGRCAAVAIASARSAARPRAVAEEELDARSGRRRRGAARRDRRCAPRRRARPPDRSRRRAATSARAGASSPLRARRPSPFATWRTRSSSPAPPSAAARGGERPRGQRGGREQLGEAAPRAQPGGDPAEQEALLARGGPAGEVRPDPDGVGHAGLDVEPPRRGGVEVVLGQVEAAGQVREDAPERVIRPERVTAPVGRRAERRGDRVAGEGDDVGERAAVAGRAQEVPRLGAERGRRRERLAIALEQEPLGGGAGRRRARATGSPSRRRRRNRARASARSGGRARTSSASRSGSRAMRLRCSSRAASGATSSSSSARAARSASRVGSSARAERRCSIAFARPCSGPAWSRAALACASARTAGSRDDVAAVSSAATWAHGSPLVPSRRTSVRSASSCDGERREGAAAGGDRAPRGSRAARRARRARGGGRGAPAAAGPGRPRACAAPPRPPRRTRAPAAPAPLRASASGLSGAIASAALRWARARGGRAQPVLADRGGGEVKHEPRVRLAAERDTGLAVGERLLVATRLGAEARAQLERGGEVRARVERPVEERERRHRVPPARRAPRALPRASCPRRAARPARPARAPRAGARARPHRCGPSAASSRANGSALERGALGRGAVVRERRRRVVEPALGELARLEPRRGGAVRIPQRGALRLQGRPDRRPVAAPAEEGARAAQRGEARGGVLERRLERGERALRLACRVPRLGRARRPARAGGGVRGGGAPALVEAREPVRVARLAQAALLLAGRARRSRERARRRARGLRGAPTRGAARAPPPR